MRPSIVISRQQYAPTMSAQSSHSATCNRAMSTSALTHPFHAATAAQSSNAAACQNMQRRVVYKKQQESNCQYRLLGCKWCSEKKYLYEILMHENDCTFRRIKCDTCQKIFLNEQYKKHTKEQCYKNLYLVSQLEVENLRFQIESLTDQLNLQKERESTRLKALENENNKLKHVIQEMSIQKYIEQEKKIQEISVEKKEEQHKNIPEKAVEKQHELDQKMLQETIEKQQEQDNKIREMMFEKQQEQENNVTEKAVEKQQKKNMFEKATEKQQEQDNKIREMVFEKQQEGQTSEPLEQEEDSSSMPDLNYGNQHNEEVSIKADFQLDELEAELDNFEPGGLYEELKR